MSNPIKQKLAARNRLLGIQSQSGASAQIPNNPLDRKMQIAKSEEGRAISMYEINRIVGLPVTFDMTDEEHEAYCRQVLQAEAYLSGFRLFKTQSGSGLAFQTNRGLFAPIGVGWGKTLITLLCAYIAYALFRIKKIVLMAPSSVMPQLLTTDLKWARSRIPVCYPVHSLYDKPSHVRRRMATSGNAGLYIMPYSLLSTKDATDNLDAIEPGLIVCDEIQYLKDRRAARTRRVMEYVHKHKPLGVGLSGTITRKSILDYHHLIRWCLGSNCPLPLSVSMTNEWAEALDASAEDSAGASMTGPLQPLVDWARTVDIKNPQVYTDNRSGFRRAYKLRLSTCPGVVSSGDAEIGTSLVVKNEKVRGYESVEGWSLLSELMRKVEDEWLTPNDDEIEYSIHKFKWLYELSAGFYNELRWPEPETLCRQREIISSEAESLIERAKDHHEAHQIYAEELRRFLRYESQKNLDTPMLVGSNMAQHGDRDVPGELYQKWCEMRAADFEGRPEREGHAIRVCPYKINAAVSWAMSLPKKKGGIIWVHHQEMGRWVVDGLREQGINPIHCPAGKESDAVIVNTNNADRVIVASITAHGTGKNLQHFEHQYMLQWPRPAGTAEQLLGRTHRNGQAADELFVVTNNTLLFDDMNFAACLNDSLYIHQTTGSRQKLIQAVYNPVPKLFPPEVLLERGLQVYNLDKDSAVALQERFGAQ